MDIIRVLLQEEKKLLAASEKIGGELSRVRAAINALGSRERKADPRKGKKLSAAHRKAIREGIAKSKAKKQP